MTEGGKGVPIFISWGAGGKPVLSLSKGLHEELV